MISFHILSIEMTSFVTSLFKLDTRLIKNDRFLHKNLKCVNDKKCTVENSFVTTQSFEKNTSFDNESLSGLK